MFKKLCLLLFMVAALVTGVAFSQEDKININTASNDELQMLSGIGETTAKAIIKYREQNGLFDSIYDLVNVKGIGGKKVEKFSAKIIVATESESESESE